MHNALPYLEGMAEVPGALDNVVELSYHRYGGNPQTDLPQIARRAAALGLRTAMLELWFGRATYRTLLQDLTVGNVSSWQGRVLSGLFDASAGASPTLSLREDVRYNAQFFRHIRIGAVRIGADTTSPGQFDPVAFVGLDGRYVAIVVAARRGTLTIRGLSPGQYTLSFAVRSGSGNLPIATVARDGVLSAQMPGKGVITIAGK
jgi:hypothetical protein